MRSTRNSNKNTDTGHGVKHTETKSSGFSLEEELSQFEESEITSDDMGDFDVGGIGDLGDLGNSLSFLENLDSSEKGEDKKDSGGKGKGKEEKKPNKKEKQVLENGYSLPKPSAGRIVGAVFTGMFFSAVLSLGVYGLYMNYIKYPAQMEIVDETTGTYCLTQWEKSIANLEDGEEGREDWYLHQEISYANDDEARLNFLHKVASTVDYEPEQVEALNVYGNTMVNRNDEIVYMDSTVGVGEEVSLHYINYKRIEIDRERVAELMEEADLKIGDVDYPNKLIDVFCNYISGLDDEDIPIKTVKRTPEMVPQGNGYTITEDEDIYIDKLLFSSEDLWDLMDRFSAVAGSIGKENPEWDKWNKLSEEEKAKTEEPSKELEEISPTEEWLKWDELPYAEKRETEEPEKYNWKDIMSKDWCGAYYLQNEYTYTDENGNVVKGKISAEVGEGTFEDPAGLNTDVLTKIYVKERNEDGDWVTNEYPIKVRMIEYGASQDAITWFEGKDPRNRGIDIESEVQYCYYIFEVTNMSDKTLTIYDNSTLADANANNLSRTGTMYGLQDTVTLEPDQTGKIETWGRSTELNKRYVIWGADFKKEDARVWFRVLAGNIDDPSEDKGVYINNSREENTEWDNSSTQVDSQQEEQSSEDTETEENQ